MFLVRIKKTAQVSDVVIVQDDVPHRSGIE